MVTVAIVPAKRFANAKRRLAEALPDGARSALARAMLGDVLAALRAVPAIDETLVVSADADVRRLAAAHGAQTIAESCERGTDRAVAQALAVVRERGAARALCVAGDCPLLDARELTALLAATHTVAIAPDRHRTGTNGLLLAPPDALAPAYGPGSFGRHLTRAYAAGVPVAIAELDSLALDVDTPADLALLRGRLAARPGGAAATRRLLAAASVLAEPVAG